MCTHNSTGYPFYDIVIDSIGSRLPVSHVNIFFIPGTLFFSWISHAELHAQSTEESDRWRNIVQLQEVFIIPPKWH